MSRRLAVPLILISALLFATFGLARLRFDTDILSMLPGDLPEVKGLKAHHRAFAREDEAILRQLGLKASGDDRASGIVCH